MEIQKESNYSYWRIIWNQFKKSRIGMCALFVVTLFSLVGLYAPFLASSKPFFASWNGHVYFPFFRYLFFKGFYTKPIDLFFNILMFTLPIGLLGLYFLKKEAARAKLIFVSSLIALHCFLFVLCLQGFIKNPESRVQKKETHLISSPKFREDPLLAPVVLKPTWTQEMQPLSDYAKLNQLLRYKIREAQHERLAPYAALHLEKTGREMPTLWLVDRRNEQQEIDELKEILEKKKPSYIEARDRLPQLTEAYLPFSHDLIITKYNLEDAKDEGQRIEAQKKYEEALSASSATRIPLSEARETIHQYQKAASELAYFEEKDKWFEQESGKLITFFPPLRQFHWEDDAGGSQASNRYLPWWELTRVNRKDLVASLLFGIRISLVVGFCALFLALLIGIPLGLCAGYFAGKTDLIICRLIEIWEAMPTFLMLLLIVAITQSKSIFLIISVLGIFGWTGLSRFIRAETLKQRHLPYVLASTSQGFGHQKIMFSHILPNAIPPILTLIPFTIMAAVTSEAGLSFLGLGEEGSTSWGVLMDEGRSVFPAESYLLWPPAILLTIFLISIACMGDAIRDAIDPKMRS